MKFKGTKGEWKIKNQAVYQNGELLFIPCTLIGRVREEKLDGESWLDMRDRTRPERIACQKEKEANTKLIAAAPDLLKALQGVLNRLNLTSASLGGELYNRLMEHESIKNADEAIKKALK